MTSALLVPVDLGLQPPADLDGLPVHAPLLPRFLPAERVDVGVVEELAWALAQLDGFRVRLGARARAEGRDVLCADDPSPLRDLAAALALRWPEAGVGGEAEAVDDAVGSVVLGAADVPDLPVDVAVAAVELWVRPDGAAWERRAVLPLAEPEDDEE